MLQIIVIQDHETEEGGIYKNIDLYPGTQIDIVWENPFFLFDDISAMFSMSFNLPVTASNLSVFDFPNRIPVLYTPRRYKATIIHSGLQIAKGEILLFSFDEDILVQFVGSVEILKNPLSDVDLGETDFNTGDYSVSTSGEPLNELDYSDPAWDDYKNNALARSEADPESDYVIAPVKKDNVSWDGHEALYGLKNSLYQYINFFNAREKNFNIGNPDHAHTPVIPFFTVKSIVDKIFGDELQYNLFADGDLAKLVMVTPGHPNYSNDLYISSVQTGLYPAFMGWYQHIEVKEFLVPVSALTFIMPIGVSADNLVWTFNQFMPQYKTNETIKDLCKIFGITIFRIEREWVMEYNNDIFDRDVIVSWDDYLHENPAITRLEPQDYVFEYAGEKSSFEGAFREFNNWNQVFLEASKAQSEVELFYKVQDSPQVLSITKELRGLTNQVWLKVRTVKTALEHQETLQFDEAVKIVSSVKPLNLSIEQYWWQNHNWHDGSDHPTNIMWGTPGDLLQKRHWHVPVIPHSNKEGAPYLMFFAGRKPVFVTEEEAAPLLLPDSLGVYVAGYSMNVSFHDTNSFEDHLNYTQGYIVEWKAGSDPNWYFAKQVYPTIDWNPPDTLILFTIPSQTFKGPITQIRAWAFSGDKSSRIARRIINGGLVLEGEEFTPTDEYPYLTNHHSDIEGNRMFDFSLLPNTNDSFLDIYHNRMMEWVQQHRIRVLAKFKLTAAQLMKVDMRDKILLHGKLFFIEKLQFTLHTDRISKTEASLISYVSPQSEE